MRRVVDRAANEQRRPAPRTAPEVVLGTTAAVVVVVVVECCSNGGLIPATRIVSPVVVPVALCRPPGDMVAVGPLVPLPMAPTLCCAAKRQEKWAFRQLPRRQSC